MLAEAIILVYSNLNLSTQLVFDATNIDIGAALQQKHENA